LQSYPNGTYASLARSHIQTAEQIGRDTRAREEIARFTLPVAHFSSGLMASVCHGHLSITSDGASYSGSEHNVAFSKGEVVELDVGQVVHREGNSTGKDIKIKLKDGHTWQFYKVAEAEAVRDKEIKDADRGDQNIASLVAARWGWTLSPDHKRLVPPRN
jgi:hypothetical protein